MPDKPPSTDDLDVIWNDEKITIEEGMAFMMDYIPAEILEETR